MDKTSSGINFPEGGIPDLMPFMVREILLVSTLYDSFILEEDGRFSDKLFSQYMELNLSSPPRMTRASTGDECLKKLKERPYDLVILMSRIADRTPQGLAKEIKAEQPGLPVVMLSYDNAAGAAIQEADSDWKYIDRSYVWTGDNRLLLVLVKSIEDMMNADHDTRVGMVRVIILVEDSQLYYSSFLSLAYTEIMEQTRFLIEDSLNHLDRIRRMRARPKILLATNFEEAKQLYDRYRNNVLGIISDVRIPRNNQPDPHAGIDLLKLIIKESPDIPVLLGSAESKNRQHADDMNIAFVDKNSPELFQEIREFMRGNFGFGDFVFRNDAGEEIARAGGVDQLRLALAQVASSSLQYHAERNHFSNWLMARGEFPLALELGKHRATDFDSAELLRSYLVSAVESFLEYQQRGRIIEFSRGAYHLGRDLVRLGGGSLGGKGRGVAFIYTLLAHSDIHQRYPGIKILVPRTTVVCTHEFDRFTHQHKLRDRVLECKNDQEIANLFLKSRISNDVHKDLQALLEEVRYPLAVRSSSLLEDSQFQPFAGVYNTYMLPNNDPSMRVRLRQLRRAIKLVYASTFFAAARAYMHAINRRVEEESMGVLIQRLVGTDFGERFYPTFSGVAQSYNFYPIRYMKPEDGIAHVALGLGRTVVEGGRALRFSPSHPHILPQMSTPDDALRNSQRQFFGLNLTNPRVKVTLHEEDTLVQPGLDIAEKDGSLIHVGATYVPGEGRIYDTIYRDGGRLVNFAPILKHDRLPLADILTDILTLGRESMGCPVEMEFAVNLNVPEGERPEFAVVQIRPLVTSDVNLDTEFADADPKQVVLRSERALGNGLLPDIRDVVYIPRAQFDAKKTLEIAEEVGQINAHLVAEGRPYVLIGPGRWGTSDRYLGIPVTWLQVSAARIIVELAMEGFDVDPSQGTHFFHNITSLKVGYLTIDERHEKESIDWEWLGRQEVVNDLKYARHIRLDNALEARLDGRTGHGVLVHSQKS
ncbi:MAG TPA: hypothetical protein EYN06_02545 [Myxococcales bacterium]|nr:hypothetical protein [Myxococcales bacterium]HIN85332.1 hypothetical protein [Myxococcales bacterium]